MKKSSWIENSFNGSNVLLLLILFGIAVYSINSLINRRNNGVFTEGISEGVKKRTRGNLRLHYRFIVDNIEYSGSVPDTFCEECANQCCNSGTVVIVRYEYDNPENSDLVVSNPNQ